MRAHVHGISKHLCKLHHLLRDVTQTAGEACFRIYGIRTTGWMDRHQTDA